MANPDHLKMLLKGVDAWNAWREREASITPDLSEADLRWVHLGGTDLHGANLRWEAGRRSWVLSAADFLSRTDYLREADLHGGHLHGGHVNGAHLSEANLSMANLSGA